MIELKGKASCKQVAKLADDMSSTMWKMMESLKGQEEAAKEQGDWKFYCFNVSIEASILERGMMVLNSLQTAALIGNVGPSEIEMSGYIGLDLLAAVMTLMKPDPRNAMALRSALLVCQDHRVLFDRIWSEVSGQRKRIWFDEGGEEDAEES